MAFNPINYNVDHQGKDSITGPMSGRGYQNNGTGNALVDSWVGADGKKYGIDASGQVVEIRN